MAWTTTPWTLPANALLAVSATATYVLLQTDHDRVWVAELALERLRDKFPNAVVLERRLGKDLAGQRYEPLFDFTKQNANSHFVRTAEFVETGEGTGFVHVAPSYGEDDFALGATYGIVGESPVLDDGTFDESVGPYLGQSIHEATKHIASDLYNAGKALAPEQTRHNYPHCWRCDSPLIYRAINTWFVAVSQYRERLVELNRRVKWVPSHIRDGRFGDWLANARDWAVSRSRFWGAPIPVWRCDDCAHFEVMGSVSDIEQRSGRPVSDLHRPSIDEHVFQCPKCSGQMHRVPDVFDCWFESGSMPFASRHYPFEQRADFERDFPADFIVEYVAQTRGWFYTLFAVSGGVFDSEPFQSAVCHGVILGRDGRKMSKRLKNYPDPMDLLNSHGSDALRAALLMSPVCKGEDIRFSEETVRDVVRRFHLLTWNCLHFYKTFSDIDGYDPNSDSNGSARLPIDSYLLHELESLRVTIDSAMIDFDFFAVYTSLEKFVNILSTWYIKLNKKRIWREGLDNDKRTCYAVMRRSLRGLALVSAPFLPFLAESIWRALGEADSVHLQDWPAAAPSDLQPALADEMDAMQVVVAAARNIRDRNNSSLKIPLRQMRIAGVPSDYVTRNAPLLLEELNVKSVEVTDNASQWVQTKFAINLPELAKRRPQIVKEVQAAVGRDEIQVNADGTATVGGFELAAHEFRRTVVPRPDVKSVAVNGEVVVWLDMAVDDALMLEADSREVNRRLQDLRKTERLSYTQRVRLFLAPSDRSTQIARAHGDYLKEQLLATELIIDVAPSGAPVITVELRDASVIAGFEVIR